MKAVFKDNAVRCEKCGVEIWEGVNCDCGVDGADHEEIVEAYEQKKKADVEVWSVEKSELRKQLNREYARLQRDKKRVRKFGPKKYKSKAGQKSQSVCVDRTGVEKNGH